MIVLGGLVLPTVTLVALLAYGIRLTEAVAAGDGAPQRVRVVAHQWWWEVHHDREGASAVVLRDEMRLPAGRPVEVLVTSADVIHSFWVPRLAGKIDAIPGRWNRLRLQADRPGELRRGSSGDALGMLPRSTEMTPMDSESAAVGEFPPCMRLVLRSGRVGVVTLACFAGTSGHPTSWPSSASTSPS